MDPQALPSFCLQAELFQEPKSNPPKQRLGCWLLRAKPRKPAAVPSATWAQRASLLDTSYCHVKQVSENLPTLQPKCGPTCLVHCTLCFAVCICPSPSDPDSFASLLRSDGPTVWTAQPSDFPPWRSAQFSSEWAPGSSGNGPACIPFQHVAHAGHAW